MKKKLNISQIKRQAEKLGLSQADLSKKLKVSRESVSQWYKNEIFPRPDKLLRLATLLKLKYNELIIEPKNKLEPRVAFRVKAHSITKPEHIETAKITGTGLEKLVQYLPFEKFKSPPYLIEPKIDENYISSVTKEIKSSIDNNVKNISISDIVKIFDSYKAILIPILWGEKNKHKNALHIFLPKSSTTWVYVNLNTKVHDFKFWMIHELGHIIAPTLVETTAERFADSFAEEFLFGNEEAIKVVDEIKDYNKEGLIIEKILSIANERQISPYTIHSKLKKNTSNKLISGIEIGPILGSYNKQQQTFAESISLNNNPTAKQYIDKVEEVFNTPFFELLKKAKNEIIVTPDYLKRILDIQILEARSIYEYLIATETNIN